MASDVRHHTSSHNNNVNHSHTVVNKTMDGNSRFHSSKDPGAAPPSNSIDMEVLQEDQSDEDKKEQIKQQTRKIMEAFLRGVLERNGTLRSREDTRKGPKRVVSAPLSENQRMGTKSRPSTSEGRVTHRLEPVKDHDARRRKISEDDLYQVMKGKTPESLGHKTTPSVGSSDSADSAAMKQGRFHRSKSFSKAQRHSVVSELEKKASITSRRSSIDIPEVLRQPKSSYETGASDQTAGSSISHAYTRSDPVQVVYDTIPKEAPKEHKEKEDKKKSRFWKKWKTKKKEGRKSKEEIKEIAHSPDVIEMGVQKRKHDKPPKEKQLSRESSISAKQHDFRHSTTPSPPASPKPKRTPNLIRRISKRKKTSKVELSTPCDVTGSRSQSLDFDEIRDVGRITPNGDSKSNSLPNSVRLTVKPPSQTPRQQQMPGRERKTKEREDREKKHYVVVDGSEKHPTRRDSYEMAARPTTLPILKKKPSAFKIFKKMLNIESSSSSSSEENLAEMDSRLVTDGAVPDHPVVHKRTSLPSERRSGKVTHTLSDHKPENSEIRGRYQHRASKSMSDIDPWDKEIAQKLRRIAEQYGHLMAQHYGGPTGRTQTPDSYRHDLQQQAKTSKLSNGVSRATSLTSGRIGSGEEISSHSLKAYYNLHPSRKPRPGKESLDSRFYQRITREQISHKPTGSFDSPHTRPVVDHSSQSAYFTERFSDRLQRAGAPPSSAPPTSVTSGASPRMMPTPPRTAPAFIPPPPPKPSQSPTIRSSRTPRSQRNKLANDYVDSVDGHLLDHRTTHVERHTEESRIVTSPTDIKYVFKSIDEVEDVETDALPFDGSSSPDRTPMTFGFEEPTEPTSDNEETTHETVTTTGYTYQGDELDDYSAATPHAQSSTSPTVPSAPAQEWGDLGEPVGAVGGQDLPDGLDEDKLVTKIVKALIKHGEKCSSQLEAKTDVLDDALVGTIRQLSFDKMQRVLTQAFSSITEISTNSSFRHPEVVKIAIIFNMADLVMRASNQPFMTRLVEWSQSYIVPLVQRVGGWARVRNDLDEAERDLNTLDEEEPGTSGLTNHNRSRRPSDTTDDELD